MALSGDDITAITQIVHQANESQFERFSEKLDLTVTPVKEKLEDHMEHDEKTDQSMYRALDGLKIGQASLRTQMHMASFIGGSFCIALIGLFFGAIKDLL